MSERENIRAALAYIPAHDRDLWLRIGMAVKSELGEDGYGLWAEWSEQDESWNERDGRDVWRSVRANGKVTIGTLYHEAQKRGFKLNGESRSHRSQEAKPQGASGKPTNPRRNNNASKPHQTRREYGKPHNPWRTTIPISSTRT
jgi:putative DNA primase/helicase